MKNILILVSWCLAGLFFAFGQLTPYHMTPWRAAFAEFAIFYSILFFSLSLTVTQRSIAISKSPGAILILILLCLSFITFGNKNQFVKEAYFLIFGYIFIFYLAFIAALNIKDKKTISIIFLSLIIISSFLQGGIAIAQWLGLLEQVSIDNWWAAAGEQGQRSSGNIWQANNYASFVLWGAIAFTGILWHLENSKTFLSRFTLILVAVFFSFSLILAQSRTSILSLIFLLVFGLCIRKTVSNEIKFYAFVFYLSVIFFWFTLPNLSAWMFSSEPSIARSFVAPDVRFPAFQMYLSRGFDSIEHAIFGRGWGSIAAVHVDEVGLHGNQSLGALVFGHTHNIFLDVFISFGLIGVLILIYLIWDLFKILRVTKQEASFVFTAMIIVFFTHANLELPHWYGYFIWPIGFIIGMMSSRSQVIKINITVYSFILFAMLLLGFVVGKQYLKYELAFSNYEFQLGVYKKIISPIETDGWTLPGLSEVLNTVAIRVDAGIDEVAFQKIILLAKFNPTPQNVSQAIRASVVRTDEKNYRYFVRVLCNIFGYPRTSNLIINLKREFPEFKLSVIDQQCRVNVN